jgi:hypothetical protein
MKTDLIAQNSSYLIAKIQALRKKVFFAPEQFWSETQGGLCSF